MAQLLVALVGWVGIAATALAQTRTAEIVFVVDESGSMDGEQTFLQSFVPALEQQLLAAGLVSVRFGLVGYGNAAVAPRRFLVGGQSFGSASAFSTAAGLLEVSGGTEDGYAGIQYVLDNYTFSAGANTGVIVLVTDEDRDNTNSALTFQVILVNLQTRNVALSAILNQGIATASGGVGIAASGTVTFVDANNDGAPEEVAGPPVFGSAAGTTRQDYTDLVLSFQNGCVADLNQLRAGGTAAQAFAVTLARCLVQQALGGSGFDVFLAPPGAMGRAALLSHADALSFRLTGSYYGVDDVFMSANAANTRRGFALLSYGEGEWDAVESGQPGFDFDALRLVMGVDQDWGSNALAGISLGYSEGESSSNARADRWKHRLITLAAHGSKSWGNGFTINGQAIIGNASFDTSRAVSTISGPGFVTASPGGDLYLLRARASRSYSLWSERLDVTPYAGVTHTKVDVDGYSEAGDGGLTVAGFSQEATTADVGVELQGAFQTHWGEVRPSVQLGVEYALDSDDERVAITTPLGGGFEQLAPAYDDRTGLVGVGATWRSDDGSSAIRLGYEGRFNDDGESHGLSIRGRIRF
jgi:uncharacterized protein YhjY with autotransporter beta-barrel domain